VTVVAGDVVAAFAARYRAPPELVAQAPGRVNLIGEHTDYNDGLVLPMAIDRHLWIAASPAGGDRVEVHAPGRDADGWMRYVDGVQWALDEAGVPRRGWRGVVLADLPEGAGLASSAALELAVARVATAVADVPWDPEAMARHARRAEHEWVGIPCGIMDQLAVALGRAGYAMLIDCRSLEVRHLPLPPGHRVLVLDTGTRRELQSSAYAERQRDCEAAARRLGLASLRDLTASGLDSARLPPELQQRVRHVVTENARTAAAAQALRDGDASALGRLWNESHASLRDDYQVSSPALDTIVALARAQPGCAGARLTGAGFGGCAIALVEEAAVPVVSAAVAAAYQRATGRAATVTACTAAAGVTLLAPPRFT
jgi:galactokinase